MKRVLFPFILIAQLAVFGGCSSAPKDLSGQTLAPIPVDQVQLYPKKPAAYDIVGTITIEITPDLKWDENGVADKAFDATKAKAASMGANGVLYELDKSDYDFLATASYHDQSYQVPIRGPTAAIDRG